MNQRDLFIAPSPELKSAIFSLLSSLLNRNSAKSTLKKSDIEIEVNKFKKIDKVKLKLEPVNIFIGTNNSGKSSFIQGIQFAISSCQTLELKKVNWVKKNDSRTLALDSSEFLYTPTKQIEHLYHGQRLTGSKTKDSRKSISFSFRSNKSISTVSIARGKNGGFTTSHHGKILGEMLNSVENPFCVYVPGIAGIPVEEKYEVPISIKKSATRGDSNNYLRNILLTISKDSHKWDRFHSSLNRIYPDTNVEAYFNENESEYIYVYVIRNSIRLPVDSIGTGVLQTIQIFAYLEYFNPQILLLDEPDSHIHPTKQKLLANELFNRANNNKDLKVVFSTHSRYILDALEDRAQVIHFQEGKAYPGIKGSKILLDIGAADADYLFAKQNLKYIIVTEDKVDNIDEKKSYLKTFLLANGLADDEFVLHSYEGCKKVYFAKLLEGFVRKHIPNVRVILHFDRDQKVDADRDLQKLIDDCVKEDILLFITEFSEIENYFCQPSHLMAIYGLSKEICEKIYLDNLKELERFTKEKMANFLLRERPDLCKNENNMTDIRVVNEWCDKFYSINPALLTPGKELLGKIKNYVQNSLKKNPQDIHNSSQGLNSNHFQNIVQSS